MSGGDVRSNTTALRFVHGWDCGRRRLKMERRWPSGWKITTDENDSDAILTQGSGLSTEVIERELPFAFITCGLRRLGSQGSGGSEDIHRVFSESVNALRETRLGEGKQGTLRCSAHREIEREIIAFLTHLAEIVGPEARFVHQGMTSSDILDTCLNVQLVRAADLLLADIDRVAEALKKRVFEHNIRSPSTTFGVKLAYVYAEFARARGPDGSCARRGRNVRSVRRRRHVRQHLARGRGLRREADGRA